MSPKSPDYEALGELGAEWCPIKVDDSPDKVDASCSPMVDPGVADHGADSKVDAGAALFEAYRERRLRAIAAAEEKNEQVFFGPSFGVRSRPTKWVELPTLIGRRRGKPINGKDLSIKNPSTIVPDEFWYSKRPRASQSEIVSQGKRPRASSRSVPFARPIRHYY